MRMHKKTKWSDYSYNDNSVGIAELREMYRRGIVHDGDLLEVRCTETHRLYGNVTISGVPDMRRYPYNQFSGGAGASFFQIHGRAEKIDGCIVYATSGELAELLS